MPEIEIKSASHDDVEKLSVFEHGYYSEFAWQMNLSLDKENTLAEFRRIRLPRRVFVPYPREKEEIFRAVDQPEAFLVALLNSQAVGYIKVRSEKESKVARISDLVVSASMRRQGIASGLILAVMNLSTNRKFSTLIMEMQSKNDPAIALANKLGFNFCGFRDHYFPNKEMALFFSRFTH